MTEEKMSVHKALAELKLLDARIEKAMKECPYVVVVRNCDTKVSGIDIDKYTEQIKASYKSINDLIRRRNAIKAAVILSNATAKAKVVDQEYTVAEAIDMKLHGIEFKKELLQELKQAYNKAQSTADASNGRDLDVRAESFLKSIFSTTDIKGAAEEVQKSREDFVKKQTMVLKDPLDIQQKIKSLEDEINKFSAEIDAALSVSNATTEITVKY